jgi:molybdate transport system ATP-binding protein
MSIEVDACRQLGNFTLDASFSAAGGLTALFGVSGSGKTSVVNIISGLLRPDRGRVVIDSRVLVDTARGVYVPRHRRRIGYVFQEPRLFPHLTVRQNLVYGRWFTPVGERRERVDHVVELLGIGALLHRGPAGLSGGEKQRVAIGRALLTSPQLLVMDEPLSGLDEARKAEVLPYIERIRDTDGVPIVYVSHSVEEVARLATTMVVMSSGHVTATGTVADVMGRIDLFSFDTSNEAGGVLELRVAAHDDRYALTTLRSAAGELRVPRLDIVVGTLVRVRVRPGDVVLALEPPDGLSALNVLTARIDEIVAHPGPTADARLDVGGQALVARVTRLSVDRLGLTRGCRVYAIIKAAALDRSSFIRPPGAS